MPKNINTLTNTQLTESVMTLIDAIETLKEQISVMVDTQLILVEEASKNNPKFMAKFMANTLSHDAIRDSFTEFLNEIDAPDSVKLEMTAINEMIIETKKKYEEE